MFRSQFAVYEKKRDFNLEKRLEEVRHNQSTFFSNIREEFVGTQLIGANWDESTTVNTAYGDSGSITLTKGILKHDVNIKEDGTPTQSDFYDKDGNHQLTIDLHPLADYKTAIYRAVKVNVEEQDNQRNFFINVSVLNKNPRSRSKHCVSQGQIWLYVSRDVYLEFIFAIAPEYLSTTVFVNGSQVNRKNVYLKKGWNLLQSVGKDCGSSIAWNYLDLLRFRFTGEDPLTPLELVITHPSCLANVALSSILEKL